MAHGLQGKALLAYVAGIVDGEGTIGLHRNYKNPSCMVTVNVGNTNEWLINFLKMNFGGYICYQPNDDIKHKDIWRWELRSKKAIEFIRLILPYLQIKRPQAELAIEFQKRRINGKSISPQVKILDEADTILMSKYNKRGKPSQEV